MPNTTVGVSSQYQRGIIGGVYRDGYTPHSLFLHAPIRDKIEGFACDSRRDLKRSASKFKWLRRWVYYGRNGGLSVKDRRAAIEIAAA